MRETPLVSRRGRTRRVEQVFRWVRDHVVEGVARWVPPPNRDLARAQGRGPVNPLPSSRTGVVEGLKTHRH